MDRTMRPADNATLRLVPEPRRYCASCPLRTGARPTSGIEVLRDVTRVTACMIRARLPLIAVDDPLIPQLAAIEAGSERALSL